MSAHRILTLFGLALGLGACSAEPDHDLDVTFDPCAGVAIALDTNSESELTAVDSAVALWNASGPLKLSRADVSGWPRLSVSFEAAAAAFRGVYDDERGMVIVNSRLDDAHTRAITVAHELGHAFGLSHAPDAEGASVMTADNVDVAPTALDVARLRARWASCAAQP